MKQRTQQGTGNFSVFVCVLRKVSAGSAWSGYVRRTDVHSLCDNVVYGIRTSWSHDCSVLLSNDCGEYIRRIYRRIATTTRLFYGLAHTHCCESIAPDEVHGTAGSAGVEATAVFSGAVCSRETSTGSISSLLLFSPMSGAALSVQNFRLLAAVRNRQP